MYYKDYSIDKYAKGGIFKDKLIGSSGNYEGILKLLKQFFYSPNIYLTEDEIIDSYYVINNAKGVIKNYYVFFSKGRYRFFEREKENTEPQYLTKTKDIEEVEITKDNNIDKLIKALQTSLKYSGANTRSKIEEQISALRIAQKYDKPSEMMAKGGKFKEYKPKFLKEGYDYGKKAYHNGINAAFYDTEFNSFLKENVYPKKDNKIVNDYLYSYNKGWNDENYKNTDWLVKGND